jgi:hypothetical protein
LHILGARAPRIALTPAPLLLAKRAYRASPHSWASVSPSHHITHSTRNPQTPASPAANPLTFYIPPSKKTRHYHKFVGTDQFPMINDFGSSCWVGLDVDRMRRLPCCVVSWFASLLGETHIHTPTPKTHWAKHAQFLKQTIDHSKVLAFFGNQFVSELRGPVWGKRIWVVVGLARSHNVCSLSYHPPEQNTRAHLVLAPHICRPGFVCAQPGMLCFWHAREEGREARGIFAHAQPKDFWPPLRALTHPPTTPLGCFFGMRAPPHSSTSTLRSSRLRRPGRTSLM